MSVAHDLNIVFRTGLNLLLPRINVTLVLQHDSDSEAAFRDRVALEALTAMLARGERAELPVRLGAIAFAIADAMVERRRGRWSSDDGEPPSRVGG